MIVFRVGFGFQLKRKFLSGKVAPAVYGSESPSCLLIRSSWWGRHNWRSNQKHGRNWKSEEKGRNFDLFFSQCPLKLSSWSTHLVANIWVRFIMWHPMLNHLLAYLIFVIFLHAHILSPENFTLGKCVNLRQNCQKRYFSGSSGIFLHSAKIFRRTAFTAFMTNIRYASDIVQW